MVQALLRGSEASQADRLSRPFRLRKPTYHERIEQVIALRATGTPGKESAPRLGLSAATVSRIRRRSTSACRGHLHTACIQVPDMKYLMLKSSDDGQSVPYFGVGR